MPSDAIACRIENVPVYLLCTQPGVDLKVTQAGSGLTLEPIAPLKSRSTIRPIALFENLRGYHDATTVMGKLMFGRGDTQAQTYTPLSHDPKRLMRALYLPVETPPDDDRVASPQRWINVQRVATDLLRTCGVSWRGLRPGDVNKLLRFGVQADPIEACLLHALTQQYQSSGDFVVEVGSYRGHSLQVMALALDGISSASPLLSVDPHFEQPGNMEHVRLALREISQESRLVQIRQRSDDAVSLIRPGRASLIFIDGDHSYEQVAADIKNYDELLAPGGCLVMHDYGFGAHTQGPDPHPGVRRAVDELLFQNEAYRPLACAHTMLAFVKNPR